MHVIHFSLWYPTWVKPITAFLWMVSWHDPISLNGNGFLMMGLEDLPSSWRLQCASELSAGVTRVSFYWDGRRKYWKDIFVRKHTFDLLSEIHTTLHGLVGDKPVSQLWRVRRQTITCKHEDQVLLTWSGLKTIWYGRYRKNMFLFSVNKDCISKCWLCVNDFCTWCLIPYS